jgi:alkylation response protein AidB-like acyl-CoA dehydrogenase
MRNCKWIMAWRLKQWSAGVPQAETRHALSAEVQETAQLALRQAPLTEQRRQLSEDLAASISASGFPSHFVPRRWGGQAGTFSALVHAAGVVGEACLSTGWCATLYAAHGRIASYLPQQGQAELWGDTPNVRIAASIIPVQGVAEQHDDGWQLSGCWRTASGVDHADWVLLASATEPGEHRIFAVPRQAMRVLKTWDTLGLRGSGSNSVQLSSVWVPHHRTFTLQQLLLPLRDGARCLAVPYPMVAALLFAAPIVGAARGAERQWQRDALEKGLSFVGSSLHEELARSTVEIHTAELLLAQAAERADVGQVTPLATAQNQRDSAWAAHLCGGAVDRLFKMTGLRGQEAGNSLQRTWRNITAATGHAALRFKDAAAFYAQTLATSERPFDA